MKHIWKFSTAVLFSCYMINYFGDVSGCTDHTSNSLSNMVLPPCDNSNDDYAIQRKRKQDIRRPTNIEYTPLQNAAMNGLYGIVSELLSKGVSVNERNAQGDTALHLAIRAGHENITYDLISHGARVNMRGYKLTTPLILAAERGTEKVVARLLKEGANANAADVNKDKALIVAVRKGFNKVVKILCHRSFSFYPNHDYKETIQSAIIQAFDDKRTDIIKILLEKISMDKETMAACMAKIWNEESFWLLIDNSEENALNVFNNTLISDVNKHRCHMLKYINTVVHQATLDEALYNSAQLEFIDCVEELLKVGANVNVKIDGYTPLYAAVKNLNYEISKLLLDAGADPNLYKSLRDTTLLAAIRNGCLNCVELLLSNGAIVNLADTSMLPLSPLATSNDMRMLLEEYESKA